MTISPHFGWQFINVRITDARETGPWALDIQKADQSSVRSIAGLRLGRSVQMPWNIGFTYAIAGAYQHEFADPYAEIEASLVGLPVAFEQRGVETHRDFVVASGQAGLQLTSTLRVVGHYEGQFARHFGSQQGFGGLEWIW